MHVGVDSEDLSVARVAHRAGAGRHAMPKDKVRVRFERSGPLIREAARIADVGLVYDDSVAGRPQKLALTFERGMLVKIRPDRPGWVRRVCPDRSAAREDRTSRRDFTYGTSSGAQKRKSRDDGSGGTEPLPRANRGFCHRSAVSWT